MFFRIREEEYNEIPNEFKERYLNSHNVSKETNDFAENMKDALYNKYYRELKESKRRLENREFYLREERRKTK